MVPHCFQFSKLPTKNRFLIFFSKKIYILIILVYKTIETIRKRKMKFRLIFISAILICLIIAACNNLLSGTNKILGPDFEMTVVNNQDSLTYEGQYAKFDISKMTGYDSTKTPADSLGFSTWPPFGYPDSSYVSIDTTSFLLGIKSDGRTTRQQYIALSFERIGLIPTPGSYQIISGKSIKNLLHTYVPTTDHLNDSLKGMFHVTGSMGSLLFLNADSGSVEIQQSGASVIGGKFRIWVSRFYNTDYTYAARNVTEPMAISGSFLASKDTSVTMRSITARPVIMNRRK